MIKGLQHTTLVDYPGKIACTIFMSGCNFRCGYCYNSDLVFNSKNIPEIKESEILDFLAERRDFLEGVCITGGEPTLYKNLIPLSRLIKKMGYTIKLDTNGSNPEIISSLIAEKLVDYIAMDVKSSLDSYDRVAGVKVNRERIRMSIGIIKDSGVEHEFRTTIVPDVITEKEIVEIVRLIQPSPFFIQQFRPAETAINKKYAEMKPLPLPMLQKFRGIAEKSVQVRIRNA